MECPKCSGGSYLAEEELVKVLEGTEPLRIIARAVFVCRACSERFSRLIVDSLEARKKEDVLGSSGAPAGTASTTATDAAEGLKFF